MNKKITTKPSFIKIRKIKNNNGTLVPFYLKKIKSFKFKRLFIVTGKKNSLRGKHAHKKCTQIIYQIYGESEISIFNKNKYKYRYDLKSNQNKMLKIPPLHWVTYRFKKQNNSIIVLCDTEYSESEYIRNFSHFIKKKFKQAY